MVFRERAFFFFNDTATTEIYTLSLHDALPISGTLDKRLRLFKTLSEKALVVLVELGENPEERIGLAAALARSEEHTSELQSLAYLVCRLLLEKKKTVLNRARCRPLS